MILRPTRSTLFVNATLLRSTAYTISTLSDGNCTAIAADLSGGATVNVNARPTAVLSGSNTICNGASATLSLTVTGTGTISVTLSDTKSFTSTSPNTTPDLIPSST